MEKIPTIREDASNSNERNRLIESLELEEASLASKNAQLESELAKLQSAYESGNADLEKFKSAKASLEKRIAKPTTSERLLNKFGGLIGKKEVDTKEGFLQTRDAEPTAVEYRAAGDKLGNSVAEIAQTKDSLKELMAEDLSFTGGIKPGESSSNREQSIKKIKEAIWQLSEFTGRRSEISREIHTLKLVNVIEEMFVRNGAATLEKLKISGFEEVDRLAHEFLYKDTPYTSPEHPGGLILMVLEELVRGLEKLGRPCPEIVEALVRKYIEYSHGDRARYNDASERDRLSGWAHGACHLFERYGVGGSLLDFSENLKAATIIVDEFVKREVEAQTSSGNDERILGPIERYNNDYLKAADLDGAFPYRPASLSNPAFLDITAKEVEDVISFLRARTPREYLADIVRENKRLPITDPTATVEVLHVMEKDFSPGVWQSYIEQHYMVNGEKLSLSQIAENIKDSEGAAERLEGVYVDVDGTLINGKGQLNKKLLEVLENQVRNGLVVTVFTGGNVNEQTDRLRSLGLPDKFLPVQSKNKFKGKRLELLIDDTQPEYQGFKAEKHFLPRDLYQLGR
jgi:ketosteroid isomerase-like protein